MSPGRTRSLRPTIVCLEPRSLPSGLTPQQLVDAYGLNDIVFSTPGGPVQGNGAGQTIALVEAYHDPYLASDLVHFDAAYNLPNPNYRLINLGQNVANPGWALEESLDVEWAHAIAPAAGIVVVEAAGQSRQALMNAENLARQIPSVSTVSMSWGFSEFHNEAAYNTYFTTPADHAGVTFFSASGDSGTQGGVQWPSSSPNVVSVGGTSLQLTARNTIASETTWISSGGGFSRRQKEPGYQYSVQSTGKRSTPDVAFDGDPNTGVMVYQTSLSTGQGNWEVVGGTSLGTPAWAAIIAIVDQGRALRGLGSLDGATQTLPALYALPSSDFNAIPPLAYHTPGSATTRALTSTGRGSPHGPNLVLDLVAITSGETVPEAVFEQGGPSGKALVQATPSPLHPGVIQAGALRAIPFQITARPFLLRRHG